MNTAILLVVVSIDSFFVGTVFGARKIKMPLSSAAVIFAVTSVMFLISAFFGQEIFTFFPKEIGHLISALIFIAVGIFMFVEGLLKVTESDRVNIHLRPLRLVVTIMREPDEGDVDRSKTIDIAEALYIGTAMSVDSSAAAMALFSEGAVMYLIAPLAGLITASLVFIGIILGRALDFTRFRGATLLSGLMMIIFGISRLL